jgi:YspA, cpYpsA-related SLOG family
MERNRHGTYRGRVDYRGSVEHCCQWLHYLEPVQQPIDNLPLAVFERRPGVNFPEPGFPEHVRECDLRHVKGAVQAAQEPLHPCRDIKRALLGLFQNPVIVVAFQTDLGRRRWRGRGVSALASSSGYDLHMRIVVTGNKDWSCPDLAARILRRLAARYGRDIVITHGDEPGVDASFAAAAKELGITAEARLIDRKTTGFPTVGQRNRELLLGGADMCLAIHNRIASCPRTRDCVLQALQEGIPTYGIETQHAIPRRIKRGDSRLMDRG